MFSMRDIYPDFSSVVSTSDTASPELGEQLVLTQGSDSNYADVMTKADRNNLVFAILGIIAFLVIFGLVK
jgi:hypothetical protein